MNELINQSWWSSARVSNYRSVAPNPGCGEFIYTGYTKAGSSNRESL